MAVSTTVQVTLPAMGESVTEGTVLEWHKSEGDHIDADETLVEISTDKVDAEVPSPVSGTVLKVYAAEGDTVTVGAVLAEILPDGASGNGSSGNGAVAPPPAEAAPPATDDAGEGTSASTLSVEISTSVSSASMWSPSDLCHSRTVPSVTDSPIAGNVTCTVVETAILGLAFYPSAPAAAPLAPLPDAPSGRISASTAPTVTVSPSAA